MMVVSGQTLNEFQVGRSKFVVPKGFLEGVPVCYTICIHFFCCLRLCMYADCIVLSHSQTRSKLNTGTAIVNTDAFFFFFVPFFVCVFVFCSVANFIRLEDDAQLEKSVVAFPLFNHPVT